jgi:hypothetical protein
MLSRSTLSLLAGLMVAVFPAGSAAQTENGCHISPTVMNIAVGEPRPLQILDAVGNESHSEDWSVDNSELATIAIEDGRPVLHAIAPGIVTVAASIAGSTLTQKITILRDLSKFRGVHWSVPPLGREIDTVQAAPTLGGSPDFFSLDQAARGTYVRAFTSLGVQLWLWKLPEEGHSTEFICGDNNGGAILAADQTNSYTVFDVAQDGKLLWSRKLEGVRKGHALNPTDLLHLVNQAEDGTWATIIGIDGTTGNEKFNLKIPGSNESESNVTRAGDKIICSPGRSASHALRVSTSGLFVNTDGLAYVAFARNDWAAGTAKCAANAVVDPKNVYFSQDDQLVLWQIHADGSLRSTVIDAHKQRTSFTAPITVTAPTGDIIPDGFGGVLLSVRWTHSDRAQKATSSPDELVYRITEDGDVAFKFVLPKYSGALHDEMVLGEKDLGFATRGGMLVAFNVKDGSEVWRWDSGISEIKISMATAGGGCVVDTPDGLVLVEDGVKKAVVGPSGSEMFSPGVYIHTYH